MPLGHTVAGLRFVIVLDDDDGEVTYQAPSPTIAAADGAAIDDHHQQAPGGAKRQRGTLDRPSHAGKRRGGRGGRGGRKGDKRTLSPEQQHQGDSDEETMASEVPPKQKRAAVGVITPEAPACEAAVQVCPTVSRFKVRVCVYLRVRA